MTAVRTHRTTLSQIRPNYAEADASDAPARFLLQGGRTRGANAPW